MIFLGKDLSGAFLEMSHKYKSEIISFQPFPAPDPMIVINSFKAIRNAMLSPETSEAMSGRPLKMLDGAINPDRCGTKINRSINNNCSKV